MMHCDCCGFEGEFDAACAARSRANFRASGPGNTARRLVELITKEPIGGMTVLDIGGGIGAIQYELLRAGAARAVNVEASPAYADAAQSEAAQRGMANRISVHCGDFVTLASSVDRADIVTLDRVICCYPDMPSLVGLSVKHARQLYGVVYPRDTSWVRAWIAFRNTTARLQGKPFRMFLHPPQAIDAIVRAAGFGRRHVARDSFWEIVLYARRKGKARTCHARNSDDSQLMQSRRMH